MFENENEYVLYACRFNHLNEKPCSCIKTLSFTHIAFSQKKKN